MYTGAQGAIQIEAPNMVNKVLIFNGLVSNSAFGFLEYTENYPGKYTENTQLANFDSSFLKRLGVNPPLTGMCTCERLITQFSTMNYTECN